MDAPSPAIRCRQIGDADISALAALLERGFPSRAREFWLRGLQTLAGREPPDGLPKYGYLLETNGSPVGVLLMISTAMREGGRMTTRCNLSSWYVEPVYRAYASMLVSYALQHKNVTYMNVSAAPHTWPIVEAQGFSRYCDGIFIALPWLNNLLEDLDATVFDASRQPSVAFDAHAEETLKHHAAHGCISLWCEADGRAHPFVFQPRRVKKLVPCAQLIYCADIADFVRFAGPVGRKLARRGYPFVIVDSNGVIPGLFGAFRSGSMTKYFKGPEQPRLGDLAYTEYPLLGV